MVKVSETPNRHQKTRTLLPVDWQYSCSLTAIPGLNASPRMAQLPARSMSQDTPPSLDGREPTPPFALSPLSHVQADGGPRAKDSFPRRRVAEPGKRHQLPRNTGSYSVPSTTGCFGERGPTAPSAAVPGKPDVGLCSLSRPPEAALTDKLLTTLSLSPHSVFSLRRSGNRIQAEN